jgi:hypothetical protein
LMLTLIFIGRKVSITPCSACCSSEKPTTARYFCDLQQYNE